MNQDSESKDVVPYRTSTGIEIGRLYQPSKFYGSGEDVHDLRDSYDIQSAFINKTRRVRYDVFHIGFAVGIVFWAIFIVVLA